MKKSGNIPSYKIAQIKNAAIEKDFEFYRFEYFVSDIDHLKHPHRHDHFAIFFVTHGTGHHVIDFQDYELKPQRIFLIAPGQVHAWKSFERVRGFVILFTKEFFSLTLQYQELRAYLFFNSAYQHTYLDLSKNLATHLRNIAENIETEHKQHNSYSQNIIRSYINILLFELTRAYEQLIPITREKDSVNQLIRDFEGLINKEFKTKHAVHHYAALLHVTPNYLNTICKKRKDKSAGELIRDRMMLEAKRLLTHSDSTIAQIAYDLNFEDNSYFGRFFKKYSGLTPAAFRDEIKKETLTHW